MSPAPVPSQQPSQEIAKRIADALDELNKTARVQHVESEAARGSESTTVVAGLTALVASIDAATAALTGIDTTLGATNTALASILAELEHLSTVTEANL